MTDNTLQPFYDYLEKERQALLTKLDAIERILGTAPRTAELRRRCRNEDKIIHVNDDDNISGII